MYSTWAPSPWYRQFTTLSNRFISNFWLKSSSCRAAWSANIVIIAGIDYWNCKKKQIKWKVIFSFQIFSKIFYKDDYILNNWWLSERTKIKFQIIHFKNGITEGFLLSSWAGTNTRMIGGQVLFQGIVEPGRKIKS